MLVPQISIVAPSRRYINGAEFFEEFTAAKALAGSMGAAEFVTGLAEGKVPRSGGNLLCGSQLLLGPAAGARESAVGLEFLAGAFALCGQIDAVAHWVRTSFAYCRDDAFETDQRRAFVVDHLTKLGASDQIGRFNTLLDGSDSGKIFVVGFNRTGTTSIQQSLQSGNVLCGPQILHERLLRDWAQRRFDRIVALCRYYEGFQDYPFAFPFTYQAMDQAFPDARFVLSMRDSAEQWYESLVGFESKALFGGQTATWDLIDRCSYCYPGFVADASRLVYRWQDYGLYDRKHAIDLYNRHNDDVQEYFAHRSGKLIVINVAEADSYPRFAEFLNLPPGRTAFDKVNAR
jgi:hypothetical protein